jgi:ABC-type transport system substrate-binding protein
MTDGGGLFERELSLIQEGWGRLGVQIEPKILPAVQVRDNTARNTFPDLYTTSTGVREAQLDIFSTASIGTPANRWAGSNRGGWSSPEFERYWTGFNTTLERTERTRQVVELSKVVSDQIPGLPLYFNIGVVAFTSNLKGPEIGTPESLLYGNLHEWTMN